MGSKNVSARLYLKPSSCRTRPEASSLPRAQPALWLWPLLGACELTQGFSKSLPCAVFILTMESHCVCQHNKCHSLYPDGVSIHECWFWQLQALKHLPLPLPGMLGGFAYSALGRPWLTHHGGSCRMPDTRGTSMALSGSWDPSA